MKSVPKSERDPQERAKRKRPTARRVRLPAAMERSLQRLEQLNRELLALSRRGAR